MSRKQTSEPPRVGRCRIENGLAGWQIVPTPLAQFIRDSFVSAAMTPFVRRKIFSTLSGTLVATVSRQLTAQEVTA